MIRFTLSQLQAFLAVAETNSFRRASEKLNITQSAVSTRITELEKHLGVRLLHRTTRSVLLTQAGDRFVAVASRALSDIENVAAGLHGESTLQSGHVIVACVCSVGETFLPHLMREFQSQYPGLKVELQDGIGDFTMEQVLSGRADFGIFTPPMRSSELIFEPLMEDELYLVTRPDHELAGRREVTLEEAARYTLVGPREGTVLRRTIDEAFIRSNLTFIPSQEAFNMQTTLQLIDAGFGIAFVPEILGARADPLGLRRIPLKGRSIVRALGILTVRGRSLSPAAVAFKEMLTERLGNLMSLPGVRPGSQKARTAQAVRPVLKPRRLPRLAKSA
jgi:DNA-binding transcriptional LysR family regulator